MGSERARAIAEAGFRRGYEACTESFAGDGECNECGCGQDRFDEWDPVYRSKPEQVAVIDAIIAAVDAQHPAPALPREVAMRVADDVVVECVTKNITRGNTPWWDTHDDWCAVRAAIVSRHLPTDEEREAADAVVAAALRRAERVRSYGRAPVSVAERDAWSLLACDTDRACDRLLAIRAKRGAR